MLTLPPLDGGCPLESFDLPLNSSLKVSLIVYKVDRCQRQSTGRQVGFVEKDTSSTGGVDQSASTPFGERFPCGDWKPQKQFFSKLDSEFVNFTDGPIICCEVDYGIHVFRRHALERV